MREATNNEALALWKRPERVVLAVSVDAAGTPDIIALGWKMRTSSNPLMFAIAIGKKRYSHELILQNREFVLAIPGANLSRQVMFCGTHTGRKINKFQETGLTPLPASRVQPPLIQECLANHECKVVSTLETGDHTIFVGKVLATWITDSPQPVLCTIDHASGYVPTLEKYGYRFGYVRENAE